jgi:serine/threonine-protein kinase HipA
MQQNKKDIYVFAHWRGLDEPKLIGLLCAHSAKGKKAFSFEYDKLWLRSERSRFLDPDLQYFSGPQFPYKKEYFGIFLDSMPDTWGRTLMRRRAAMMAKEKNERTQTLYDLDYLLGVFDESRMGALRFKTDLNGDFLDNNLRASTPPWSSVRELQHAASHLEDTEDIDLLKKWLSVLIAPGSSLGGARPKSNVLDSDKNLWIAKFPSKNDTTDKAAWEFLAHQLAVNSGVVMSPCSIEKVSGLYNTFFTKRFDREKEVRIHFASAMTMLGKNEELMRDQQASYLEIAEFINYNCAHVEANLHQLWRRIVFNIAISNTDDHLRNHGFLLTDEGWNLSPAYDLNPSIDKAGLALNIDMESNALDFELAKQVGDFFRLNNAQMQTILDEVVTQVKRWKTIADAIGISRGEQMLMGGAFNI